MAKKPPAKKPARPAGTGGRKPPVRRAAAKKAAAAAPPPPPEAPASAPIFSQDENGRLLLTLLGKTYTEDELRQAPGATLIMNLDLPRLLALAAEGEGRDSLLAFVRRFESAIRLTGIGASHPPHPLTPEDPTPPDETVS